MMGSPTAAAPIVRTASGRVKGLSSRVAGTTVFSFRNLPYGNPPTGRSRFMPAESVSPWAGVLDCTRPTCYPMQNLQGVKEMQRYTPFAGDLSSANTAMTEDCLKLSVYTPQNLESGKRPVMVWLYGGSFQMGGADMYDGSILAAKHDIVVVVPNYRVGVFGFFSLGPNSPCTGNAGLLDQLLALKWVQENIEHFGGNKNNVTIFGESAGGISVNHHVNSAMSSGLFHKAISHSGQATLPKLFKRDLTRARENFLDILNIKERDPVKLLGILQRLPAELVAKADKEMLQRFMAFDPTYDGKFIDKTPQRSLLDGPVNKVPYIIGCNDSEGQGMLTLLARIPDFQTGMKKETAEVVLTNFLPRMSADGLKECQETCLHFYKGDPDDKYRYSKLYGDIYRDSLFVAPAVKTAKSHFEAGCSVYFYYGCFQLRMNHDSAYGPNVAKKPEWCFCDHSDDIFMMWGAPFAPERLAGGAKFTDDEKKLSAICMKYITNFAKTGNPNVGEPVTLVWPLFSHQGKYIKLCQNISVSENLLPESVRFWSQTIFDIAKKHDPSIMRPKL